MPESEIDLSDKVFTHKRIVWDRWKLAVLAVFSLYFLDVVVLYKDRWCFIDGMNIWIHEAGHFLFMVSGSDFLMIAGGTLMQLIVPIVFVVYFLYSEQGFSASLTLFWLGESLVNVSVYMRDAVDMVLPLIGGGGPESHDWHNMFSMLGLLPYTQHLANITHSIAILIVFFAIGWGLSFCRKEEIVQSSPVPQIS